MYYCFTKQDTIFAEVEIAPTAKGGESRRMVTNTTDPICHLLMCQGSTLVR